MKFHFLASKFLIPRIESCNFSCKTNTIRFANTVNALGTKHI